MNKYTLNHLVSKVERLEERIIFYKEFLPITIKEKKDKIEKKLKYLKEYNNEKLKPLAIKAGIRTEYVDSEKQNTIEKLEKKYSLKLRALKQTKKRKLAKAADVNEIEKVFAEKEKELLESKDRDLKRIQNYYQKDKNIVDAKQNYQNTKTKLDANYEKEEIKFNKLRDKMINKSTEKINTKISRIQIVIDRIKSKIKSGRSQIADLNYGVEKDVILRLEDLSMRFGGLVAVNKLSFDVKQGEIFGLIGPNGAGKTTIFNCITRFYRPTAGKMYFRQNEFEVVKLNDYKVHNVVKLGISRTFQNVELIWELSILDNLLVSAHTKYQTGFFGQLIHSRNLSREESVFKKKAQDILALMDLLPYQYALPMGLPYGILKRIELARTLMINPKMIILDEPAAGLNEQETKTLAETIRKIRKEYNSTIFLVEHDMGLVMDVCDTVCAISFGKKLAIGTPKEIQENKSVREAYLGEEE